MDAKQLLKIAKKGNLSKASREAINLFLKKHGYTWRKESKISLNLEVEVWVLRASDGREITDAKAALEEIAGIKPEVQDLDALFANLKAN